MVISGNGVGDQVGYVQEAKKGKQYGCFAYVTHMHSVTLKGYCLKGININDGFNRGIKRCMPHDCFIIELNPGIHEAGDI